MNSRVGIQSLDSLWLQTATHFFNIVVNSGLHNAVFTQDVWTTFVKPTLQEMNLLSQRVFMHNAELMASHLGDTDLSNVRNLEDVCRLLEQNDSLLTTLSLLNETQESAKASPSLDSSSLLFQFGLIINLMRESIHQFEAFCFTACYIKTCAVSSISPSSYDDENTFEMLSLDTSSYEDMSSGSSESDESISTVSSTEETSVEKKKRRGGGPDLNPMFSVFRPRSLLKADQRNKKKKTREYDGMVQVLKFYKT